MEKKKDSNALFETLRETAEKEGYTIIMDVPEQGEINILAFPARETVTDGESLSRSLTDTMSREGLLEDAKAFDRMRKDLMPGRIRDYAFSGFPNGRSFRVSVISNSNSVLRTVNLKP